MTDTETFRRGSYAAYVATTFLHALVMTLRRRRVLLGAGIALCPVLIPLPLAFLSANAFAEDGSKVFVHLVENLCLEAMAPLLALFFGVMLIGEDVESQTIPYLLTRPIPRTSIVLGRFGAYLVIAVTILSVSIVLTFTACTALGALTFSNANLTLLAHYLAVAALSLLTYGALSIFLGALLRHPIVVGILLIFGWQPIVLYIPGLVDFLTISKYLTSLYPALATQRENVTIQTALGEFQKQFLYVNAPHALLALGAMTVLFLAATCFVVVTREYSNARAIGA